MKTLLQYVDGTCVEALRSKRIRKNNTSGVPGVAWIHRDRLWPTTIFCKGKSYYPGGCRNIEDAVKARKEAEEALCDDFFRKYAITQAQSANG